MRWGDSIRTRWGRAFYIMLKKFEYSSYKQQRDSRDSQNREVEVNVKLKYRLVDSDEIREKNPLWKLGKLRDCAEMSVSILILRLILTTNNSKSVEEMK